VRQRLGEIGIERPIPSGIRAGGRHSPIEQCPAEPGPGRPARIDASSAARRPRLCATEPARVRER
jgi:hypothetical protein